ncbi:conserved hypothetical protein [Neospora caninum Liverpool]|nr:conserved hypothetical protein [Neospora caninum Liverpool]CBZ52630.1 conserved hypothetical protein [Neospora caninum Liverpool]|eukprot:XP_003882662.1 conserved hypothetical protein [Neospora caninum Liverpool]
MADTVDPNSLSYAFHSVFLLDHAVSAHMRLRDPTILPPASGSTREQASFFLDRVAPQLPVLLQSLMPFLASSSPFVPPFRSYSSPFSSVSCSSSPATASSAAGEVDVSASKTSESDSLVSPFMTPRFASLSELLRAFLPLLTRQLLAAPAVSSLLLLHLSRHVSSLFPSPSDRQDTSLAALKREEEAAERRDEASRGTTGKRSLQQKHERRLYLFLLSSLVTQNPSLSLARETVASHLLPSPHLDNSGRTPPDIPNRTLASVPSSSPAPTAVVPPPRSRAPGEGSLEEFDAVEDARIYLQAHQRAREEKPETREGTEALKPLASLSRDKSAQTTSTFDSSSFPSSLPSSPSFSSSSLPSPSSRLSSSVLVFDASAVPLQRSVRGSLRVAVSPLLSSLSTLEPAELLQAAQLVVTTASLRHPVSLISHLLGHLTARVHAGSEEGTAPLAPRAEAGADGHEGRRVGGGTREKKHASFGLTDLGAVATVGAQLVQLKSGRQGDARNQDGPPGALQELKTKNKHDVQVALQQQFRALLTAIAERAEAALIKEEAEEGQEWRGDALTSENMSVEGWDDEDGDRHWLVDVSGDEDSCACGGSRTREELVDGSVEVVPASGDVECAEKSESRTGRKKRQDERSFLHAPKALLELLVVFDVAGLSRPHLASLVERRILSYPKFREIFGINSPASRDHERDSQGDTKSERQRGRRKRQPAKAQEGGEPGDERREQDQLAEGESRETDEALTPHGRDSESSPDTSTSTVFLRSHLDEILHLLHFLAESVSSAPQPASCSSASLFAHLLPALSVPQLLATLSIDMLLCALDILRRLLRFRQPPEALPGDSASAGQKREDRDRSNQGRGRGAASRPEAWPNSHVVVNHHAERFLYAIQKHCLTKSFLGSLRNGELLLLEEVLRELGERNLQVEEERMQRQLPEPVPKRLQHSMDAY